MGIFYDFTCPVHVFLQHWTKLKCSGALPLKRAGHVAVCLGYNREQPLLLVTGGVDEDTNVLHDVWTLDIHCAKWREVGLGTASSCLLEQTSVEL